MKYGIYRRGHGFYIGEFEDKKDADILVNQMNSKLFLQARRRNKKKSDDEIWLELVLYEARIRP